MARDYGALQSLRLLKALQRLADAGASCLRFLAFLALAFDHVFGRSPQKFGVGELGLDPGNVAHQLSKVLFEPSGFRRKIDHTLKGQRDGIAAHHELNGTRGRGAGKGERRNPGEPTNDILPSACPLPRRLRWIGENERNLRTRRHIDFNSYRTDLADEIDDPADLGFGGFIIEPLMVRPISQRQKRWA